jgi:hypothetical protein
MILDNEIDNSMERILCRQANVIEKFKRNVELKYLRTKNLNIKILRDRKQVVWRDCLI